MPRIPAAIAVVLLVATCIGFNTARFPVVLEMAAVPEASPQTKVVVSTEESDQPADPAEQRLEDSAEDDSSGSAPGRAKPSRASKAPDPKDEQASGDSWETPSSDSFDSPWESSASYSDPSDSSSDEPVGKSSGYRSGNESKGAGKSKETADADREKSSDTGANRSAGGQRGSKNAPRGKGRSPKEPKPGESVRPVVASMGQDPAPASEAKSDAYGSDEGSGQFGGYAGSGFSSTSQPEPGEYGRHDGYAPETSGAPSKANDGSSDPYGYGGHDSYTSSREDSPAEEPDGDSTWPDRQPIAATPAERYGGESDSYSHSDSYSQSYADPNPESRSDSYADSGAAREAAGPKLRGLDLVPVVEDSSTTRGGSRRDHKPQAETRGEKSDGSTREHAESVDGVVPLPPVDDSISPPALRPTADGSIPLYPSTRSA